MRVIGFLVKGIHRDDFRGLEADVGMYSVQGIYLLCFHGRVAEVGASRKAINPETLNSKSKALPPRPRFRFIRLI